MNGQIFKNLRSMRIVVVLLALLMAYGAISYSPRAASSIPTYSIGLEGVTGVTNNTVLAYGRYLLVAPFWPSKGIDENGDLDVSLLDNSVLYVFDTKKPGAQPLTKQLTSGDPSSPGSKTVYFPSKVVFDPASKNVYIRGTRFEDKEGEVIPIDVIAYVQLNLESNGKPVFSSNVVPIDIQGVSSQFTGPAPLDFGFGSNGDLMVFTNGASVFSFNLDYGYLYELPIVHPTLYGTDDSISFLDVDPKTNIVSICENVRSVDKEGGVTYSSSISFHKLRDDGTFSLLKLVSSDQFPTNTILSRGSNVAVVSETDSSFALFTTTDGALWSIDLDDGPVQVTAKRLHTFPELSTDVNAPSALLTRYDPAKRVIGVVKPGFDIQISRPINGKKGRISRPINIASETPVLAMARLGKKNKVVSTTAYDEEFKSEGGLTNIVNGDSSQWLISSFIGNLYSIDVASDLPTSNVKLLGQVGTRVNRIDYYADRANVVAINSFALDENGMQVSSPGALVVGKVSGVEIQSKTILETVMPTVAAFGKAAPKIRRPCNIIR
jgi:hypothetical protein